jgi:ABC-type multidrug transport system ATPase subunit
LILAAAGSVLISASSSSTGPMDVHSIISIISIMLVLTSLFIILMQPSDAGSDNTAWAKAAMKGVQDKEDYDTSAKECNAFISGFSRIFDYTTVAVICASFITGVTDIEASAIDNNPGYFVVAVIGCGFCGFGVLVNFIVPLICGKRALNEESDKVGTQSASNPRFVEGEVDAPEDNDVVPLILSWEKVGLEVSKRSGELKTILKNSAGFCAPRTLTAVLGPSGAGKSSLMEILALRTVRAPTAESKVLINGNPAGNYKGVHRLMGYVPQHDILHEYLTVLETLQFTSQLTLSQSMSEQAKVDRMLRVVAQLGLGHILDTRVGGENVRGISGGERRRVSIALQMIKSPSILFLDEPTSGLDAHLALRLVKVLRELANEGRTVFATIHQPSAACFEYFDRTIIRSAGCTVYSGSRTGALVFMKENGREVPFNWNPADWLLTVVDVERDERVIQEDGDQVVYKNDAQTETILRRRGIISVDQRFKATTSVSALSLDVAELRDCVKMYYKQVNPTKLVEQPGVIEEIVTYALSKGVDALDKKLRSRYNVSITPLMSGRQRKQNLEPCTMDELKALISKFTASYHGAELMDRVRGAKEDARHSLSIAVANSHAAAVLKELEEGALKNDGSSDELVFSRSFLDQSRLLAQRSLRLFWRNPQAFRFQAFQNLLFGVILGALYSNSSKLQSSTFQETIFIAIIEAMVAFVTVGLGTQVAFNERLVLEREMSDAMYSPIAHYLQRLIVSIPVSSFVAVCLILPSYFWIGLNSSPSAFFFFCFVNVLIVFCFDSVVFFITLIATDINNAWAIGNFYEAMTIFFAGVFIPLYAMPVYFQWLYFLSPFSYAFAAAVVNQFTGSTQGFIVESQGILLQNAWGNAMILLGFGVMWRLLGLYGIIRLFRKKRPGNMAWHKRHDRADIIGFDSKSPALSV